MTMKAKDTATELLNKAQQLVQERGFNAFSYKDLAEAVGIRTASIHYHFPSKADLGVALMERYTDELNRALLVIDEGPGNAKSKLEQFIALYSHTEACGAICLCGSLASDRETLSPELQESVTGYLERSEAWLASTLTTGAERGDFTLPGEASDLAASLLSSLQGGLILSRARGSRPMLSIVEQVFLRSLA
jgi:TetR/AcrR family transcriptional repressor of nem operon